jgi:hypothetical protein
MKFSVGHSLLFFSVFFTFISGDEIEICDAGTGTCIAKEVRIHLSIYIYIYICLFILICTYLSIHVLPYDDNV